MLSALIIFVGFFAYNASSKDQPKQSDAKLPESKLIQVSSTVRSGDLVDFKKKLLCKDSIY